MCQNAKNICYTLIKLVKMLLTYWFMIYKYFVTSPVLWSTQHSLVEGTQQDDLILYGPCIILQYTGCFTTLGHNCRR